MTKGREVGYPNMNKNRNFEVTFFVYKGYLTYCGSILNSIQLWHEAGYSVNVFSLYSKMYPKDNSAIRKNYTSILVTFPFLLNLFCRIFNRISRIGGHINLSSPFLYLANLSKIIYFCLYSFLKTDRSKRHILIGVDPEGLCAARLLAVSKRHILVYWSYELWIMKDVKHCDDRLNFLKKLEIRFSKKAICTISQDDIRAELLRRENGLPKGSMISIPNSPLGKAKMERNYYFNDKFGIPLDKKIILYAGVMGYDTMIHDMVEYTDNWPECVLVLHGFVGGNYLVKLKNIFKRKDLKVFLSLDSLPYDQIDIIYSSADIGLSFYRPLTTGSKYVGLSSGKMLNHMKVGVPTITNDLPGYRELIEENGVGVCVSNMSQIGLAIRRILENEQYYKKNCLRSFKTFSFEDAHNKLVNFVERKIKAN